jgi:hypothetical protein
MPGRAGSGGSLAQEARRRESLAGVGSDDSPHAKMPGALAGAGSGGGPAWGGASAWQLSRHMSDGGLARGRGEVEAWPAAPRARDARALEGAAPQRREPGM